MFYVHQYTHQASHTYKTSLFQYLIINFLYTSIGSLGKYEDEEDVTAVQVKNCTLRDTTNGIRIKTFPFKPNVIPIRASGFLFKDIVMDNVKNPIIIDQEYCGRGHSCVNGVIAILIYALIVFTSKYLVFLISLVFFMIP